MRQDNLGYIPLHNHNLSHPVRSGVLKHSTGCVVVGWVTTSEFQLLYVFLLAFFEEDFILEIDRWLPRLKGDDTFSLEQDQIASAVMRDSI
jgi:hypothetical protein